MKITHTESGKSYHLKPGTQLEIERTNLFFNEWGEQSNPMELPDTEHNRQLLGYPDLVGNEKKPSTQIPVTIEDDGYFMACRQAILGAQHKNHISTAFFMNEGSFLARISNTSLAEVFGDEMIPDITTVAQGVEFCRSLIGGTHPHFAIFPVLISSDESHDNGYPIYKYINRYGYTNQYGEFQDDAIMLDPRDFYNAIKRTEKVDDQTIDLSPGYYISPFIRANYLLKRIFQYFGYTLLENFFTQTTPFPDMVLLNNCADTLVNGHIRLVDLVPDCMCSTILNLYRKKFCCEFIPNEALRTVDIKLFNDVYDSVPESDLTPYKVSEPSIEFPEAYQQLIISSDETLSDDASVESYDSMGLLMSKYPDASYDPVTGCFIRLGYKYNFFLWSPSVDSVLENVAPSSMRYYAGGILKTKEIKVPDTQPEYRNIYNGVYPGMPLYYGPAYQFLYVGDSNFLNSKLIANNTSQQASSTAETKSENSSLKPMLAFHYKENNCPRGTITNIVGAKTILFDTRKRLSDYTLCYNGPDGIFERFYRKYDDLYRNSLHKVKVKLLLSNTHKQFLSAHLPVLLSNQKLFIDKMKYQIGGQDEPLETELLTMKLYDPISSAPVMSDNNGYAWVGNNSNATVTESVYKNSPYKDKTFEVIYPPRPTVELAIAGKKYYEQTTCVSFAGIGGTGYMTVTYWLECVKGTTT